MLDAGNAQGLARALCYRSVRVMMKKDSKGKATRGALVRD